MELDHEKLDVYRVALDFAAWAYTVCRTVIVRGNQVRDQEIGDGDEYEYECEEDEGQQAGVGGRLAVVRARPKSLLGRIERSPGPYAEDGKGGREEER